MPRRKRADAPCPSCGALEAIIALQNGALDEIGREIEGAHGGMIARIVMTLERHGVRVRRSETICQ